ncbi:hypothetical protein DPMN_161817 [Dreissena polymorpha]|uniref:Uncharacterized protein n=1 Tax=Dreissena polymorpha TaxID=45954 RepID=A0A9D4EP62_DREPO|nr:hypothetical protein DPMN_161817 [Dreissena polymorpha]
MNKSNAKLLEISYSQKLEWLVLMGEETVVHLCGKPITLQPNVLNGLAQLKILKFKGCECKALDVLSCRNLETINLRGEGLSLQPNAFHGLALLNILKIKGSHLSTTCSRSHMYSPIFMKLGQKIHPKNILDEFKNDAVEKDQLRASLYSR